MSSDLATSLEILVFGWGGIFLVMLIIYLASLILTKVFPPKDDENETEQE